MKLAGKEALENNKHQHGNIKTIAKAHVSIQKCPVQKAVYHILPELKLTRILPAVYYVNTNSPEERIQVFTF